MASLYDFELSAECYQVRLFMALNRIGYDTVPVDIFPGRDQDEDWFRRMSPEGRLPVLVDGPNTIAGALDVLRYLAAGRAEGNWLGAPGQAGELLGWLQLSEQLGATLGAARLAMNFGVDADLVALHDAGRALLRQIDEHLWFAERESAGWLLAGDAPSLADIACFPDLALCEEGGVSRQDYPAIRRWLDRVKRLDGFVTMSGVFPTAAAK